MRLLSGPWWRPVSRGEAGGGGDHSAGLALVLDLDGELQERLRPLLARRGFAVEDARRAGEALSRLEARAFRLVACGYPLADMVLRQFLDRLRAPASASRRSSVLVLALPELAAAAEQMINRGANAVLPRHAPDGVLSATIERLTSVAPRARVSWPVTVSLPTGPQLCGEAVNVSISGALLACPGRPRVGAHCLVEMVATGLDEPIATSARVVRHAVPGREPAGDFAVCFEGLEPMTATKLEQALAH